MPPPEPPLFECLGPFEIVMVVVPLPSVDLLMTVPLGRLGVHHLARGSAATATAGSPVIVIGQGGRAHSLKAELVAKREFAGYWEYVLD